MKPRNTNVSSRSIEVGDLVELSAYGNSIKLLKEFQGDIGLYIGGNLVMWSSKPSYSCIVNRRDVKKIRT